MLPLFRFIQGSAFHFQYLYGPPHPVKKCVIFSVRGLLCFEDPRSIPSSPDAPFRNIVQRPRVKKLFAVLFEKFHVGLWSSLTRSMLFPLLRHILPVGIMESLSFIFSREACRDFAKYPWCYKMCDTLFKKTVSKAVCMKDQILFVDVRPLSLTLNPDALCYLPDPFVGDLHYPNKSNVIPNIATDILPFIYPLHRFGSVLEYRMLAVRSGQMHYVAAQCLRYNHSRIMPSW